MNQIQKAYEICQDNSFHESLHRTVTNLKRFGLHISKRQDHESDTVLISAIATPFLSSLHEEEFIKMASVSGSTEDISVNVRGRLYHMQCASFVTAKFIFFPQYQKQ